MATHENLRGERRLTWKKPVPLFTHGGASLLFDDREATSDFSVVKAKKPKCDESGSGRDESSTSRDESAGGWDESAARAGRQWAGGGSCWRMNPWVIRRHDAIGGPRIDTTSRMSESCSRPDRSRLPCRGRDSLGSIWLLTHGHAAVPRGWHSAAPQSSLSTFASTMETYRERLQEAARELAAQYDTIKPEAQRRLGTLFNASDCPSTLDGLFDLQVSYPTIEPPNYLMALHQEAYQQEQARVRERFESAVELADETQPSRTCGRSSSDSGG